MELHHPVILTYTKGEVPDIIVQLETNFDKKGKASQLEKTKTATNSKETKTASTFLSANCLGQEPNRYHTTSKFYPITNKIPQETLSESRFQFELERT